LRPKPVPTQRLSHRSAESLSLPRTMAQAPAQATMSWQEHSVKIAERHEKTTWLAVCPFHCGGCGVAPLTPVYAQDTKQCCIESHSYCEGAFDGDSGCCFQFQKQCCCVTHCACPPGGGKRDGVPMFACCGVRCGKDLPAEVPTTREQIMRDAFLLYYCCFTGCGVTRCRDPLVMGSAKTLCCRTESRTTEICTEDGNCCFAYSKLLCCVDAKVGPCCFGGRADGVPGCALCGVTLCNPRSSSPARE